MKRKARAEAELAAASPLTDLPDREVLPIATLVLPALQGARKANVRLEREIAALRVVEVLRMHAAETGSLPKSLDQVTCVPVPLNPSTNHSFEYQCDGTTAKLVLPESDGAVHETASITEFCYEVTLAEKP